jgi:flagellar protein FliS
MLDSCGGLAICLAMIDPQTLNRAHRDYLESRVLSAHPVEIVQMLYQVAIDNLNAAIAHLKNGDRFARSYAVSRAEEALAELSNALDHSVNATFTRSLADLYDYALRQIIMGHARQSEKPFQEALSILTTLASAWDGVRAEVINKPAEPIVEEEPAEVSVPVKAPSSPYAESVEPVLSRDWSC